MKQQSLFEDFLNVEFVRRRNQKNLRLKVSADKVIVSGPYHCSEKQLKSFLKEKKSWVEDNHRKMLARKKEVTEANRFHQGMMPYRGDWIKIMFKKRVYLDDGLSRLSMNPECDRIFWERSSIPENDAEIQDFLKSEEGTTIAGEFLKNIAKSELKRRFVEVADSLPFTWRKIFVRSQRTKWGTCSKAGNISLNWRLIKCPDAVIDYIIVHELCHTQHFNHSKSFWELVDHHYPQRRVAEAWLKANEQLMFQNP